MISARLVNSNSLRRSDRWLGLALVTPAVILLLSLVAYPLGRIFYDSFFSLRLTDQAPGIFIGFENYLYALEDRDVRSAFFVTLALTLITVPGALVLGLLLALAGNINFRWRWPIRLALLLPWVLPMSFTGMIFAWFFHSDYGVVNDLLRRFGYQPVAFLLSPGWAFFTVAVAVTWKTSSFVALILLPGLQTIPQSLYEAADLEGASRWQRFRHITLPLLMPAIVVALIFRTLSAVQTFDIPYAMTQGGPGQATQTLAMLVNTVSMEYLDIGYGSSLAVLLFLMSLIISLPYLKHLRRSV
ncbi:MAG: sugar ABC transporter permease [Cellvibrio sp.]|uniref:carbohydrate ABC transporter permease n=1 Tax=Cellvibrio sp. TaxID=1965322 RepID=UPI0031A009ED